MCRLLLLNRLSSGNRFTKKPATNKIRCNQFYAIWKICLMNLKATAKFRKIFKPLTVNWGSLCKTEYIFLFNGRNYKVSILVCPTASSIHPIKVFDIGVGLSIALEKLMQGEWKRCKLESKRPSLKVMTSRMINSVETIALHVWPGISTVTEACSSVRSLVVPVFSWTILIERFGNGIPHPEWRIYHSKPVWTFALIIFEGIPGQEGEGKTHDNYKGRACPIPGTPGRQRITQRSKRITILTADAKRLVLIVPSRQWESTQTLKAASGNIDQFQVGYLT